jgi:hypothetical protein
MKLKTKLSKLRHDGHITDVEYSIIINALNKKSKERVQQPCEDAISRAELLKYAQLVRDDEGIVHEMVHVDDIKYATPIAWTGWTPASQHPEPNTAVLLTVRYKSSGQWTYQLGMWNDSKQTWEDWRTPYDLEEEFEIIKWMELPEGYEEDKHE